MLLGELEGWLEVIDINNLSNKSSHEFKDADKINDIIAIDETHFLLAAFKGLFKTTKDQMTKHYFKWNNVSSLCHITEAIYLVAIRFRQNKLIVWDEKTD